MVKFVQANPRNAEVLGWRTVGGLCAILAIAACSNDQETDHALAVKRKAAGIQSPLYLVDLGRIRSFD